MFKVLFLKRRKQKPVVDLRAFIVVQMSSHPVKNVVCLITQLYS